MRLLIVDDCPDTRRVLGKLLQSHGYDLIEAVESGPAALAFLKADDPSAEPPVDVPPVDVVLMDLDMPGMDGIEVCRQIKATSHLKDLAVLILTGVIGEETLERAFAAGACDYITKPVSINELLARVRSAGNLKRQFDQCKMREQELVQVTRQLKRVNEELQRLSILDELTGIANRRFFNILITQEWGRAIRSGQPLSLLLIDIDYFKAYNDFYGHPQGDRCLQQVAASLNVLARRPGDCVARYGGEEFVFLLADTGLTGAAVVAETLRENIEALHLEHAASPVNDRVTISVGVASVIPERDRSLDELLSSADQAVYQAKRTGRNCIKVFQGSTEVTLPVSPARQMKSQQIQT